MKYQTRWSKKFAWRKWFAWYPVSIGGGHEIWWEEIERKMNCEWGDCFYEYREIIPVDNSSTPK